MASALSLAMALPSRDAAAADDIPSATPTETISPPELLSSAEATYPVEELRARREATVGLELDVDANGHVTAARVTKGAGDAFDRAALEVARRFSFQPAKRGSIAIASTVQLAYEFHLPKASDPVKPADAPSTSKPTPTRAPTDAPALQTGDDQSTLVVASRPISAASSMSVRDREFSLRPIGSVQDILRVTPGLVMVQHSGGGKANQYFLRGFDADHGTDLALSIDGIPINMVSHAHGQGFSDTNFIIPELIERVELTKGPYFAEQGDFATAGSVNLVTRNAFEHTSMGFGLSGSPGHGNPGARALLIASPRFGMGDGASALDRLHTIFAAEIGKQDGPFIHPENWNKYKLFGKLTYDLTPTSSLAVGLSSYAGDWHGSGQIPARAVAAGWVDFYGSIDPSEGGDTARHQAFASVKLRPDASSEFLAMAFAGTYRFDLYSNFTLYLVDPDNGDEIHQLDRRTFEGASLSYRVVRQAAGIRFDTRIGAQLRNDDIHNELWHTRERQHLGQVRGNDVQETSIGAYVREEIAFTPWLRLVGGLRADYFNFAVQDALEVPGAATGASSGGTGASQLSPKASLVTTPIQRKDIQLDLYANYGEGFHSNDARGVVLSGDARVTALTRARGEEVGARTRLFRKLDFAAAFWKLNLDSETIWNGDDGTTSPSSPTLRYGTEVEARYEILPWLAVDGDVTWSHSEFTINNGNGTAVSLAPRWTWSGGVSARHPSGIRGGLRFYGISDRPASQDGSLTAPGFTQVDLHVGYRHRWFDLALDIENLLDQRFRSAQFETVSRLPSEPSTHAPAPAGTCGYGSRLVKAANGNFAGCDDVDFTPAYPLTIRFMATAYFD